jgi:hypothetical protein
MKRFRELSLERGNELPWFPRYQVLIHSDGSVEWDGRAAIVEVGHRAWALSSDQVDALQQLLQQVRFTDYEDGCRMFRNQTPLPTIRILFEDGRELRMNTLRDWTDPAGTGAALTRFNALANAIDDIAGTEPYVRSPYPRDARNMSFWSLTLERGPCYGACPVYAVNVAFDGRVDWVGEMFVEAQGERSWTVPEGVVEKLRQSLVRAKFTELQDRYDNYCVTDCSSATITAEFVDGRTKRIYHYHGHWAESPEEQEILKRLEWLEKRIDRLLGTKEYIGKRP